MVYVVLKICSHVIFFHVFVTLLLGIKPRLSEGGLFLLSVTREVTAYLKLLQLAHGRARALSQTFQYELIIVERNREACHLVLDPNAHVLCGVHVANKVHRIPPPCIHNST